MPRNHKGIAFLLLDRKGKKDLTQYAVAIDQVKERTGINFFHRLPDRVEKRLERQANGHQSDFDAKV